MIQTIFSRLSISSLLCLLPVLGCAVPMEPEQLGSARQALCSGGVVLGGLSETAAQQVAEDEDKNYESGSVMTAGLYTNSTSTQRNDYLSATLPTGWTSLSSATWTFVHGPVDKGYGGTFTLSSSPGPWSPSTLLWSNQPGVGTAQSTLAITGSESSWPLDATAYYEGVMLDGDTDDGMVLTKVGPACTQSSDCLFHDCIDGYCAWSTSQMWAAACTGTCEPPTLTLCP